MSGESFYRPSATLDAMTGRPLPGGCDDCDAVQELAQVERGVYVLQIRHDVTCPEYRRIVAQRGGKS
jgi:hypothetical protein